MKKRVFLTIILTVIIVCSFVLGATAFGAEYPSKGSVDSITANSDTYIYTNKTFKYTKSTESQNVLAWKLTSEQFATAKADLRAYVLGNMSSQLNLNNTAIAKIDAEKNVEILVSETDKSIFCYYVFIEDHGAALTDPQFRYSDVTVVCVDTIAPVVDSAKLLAWLSDSSNESGFENSFIYGSDEFKVPTAWAESTAIVVEQSALVSASANDASRLNIYIQYLSPNDYDNGGNWTDDTEGSATLSVTTVGSWKFRFVVEDLAGNVAILNKTGKYQDGTDATYVLELTRQVQDNTPPTISYTSTTISNAKSVTAGSSYAVPSPSTSDASGTPKLTYIIERKTSSGYEVIYDSTVGEVEDQYTKYTDGKYITPVTADISKGDAEYAYRITHTATDAYGNAKSETLNVLVIAPDAPADPYNVWKIVLIVIAAVAAVGIIALLFVKPVDKKED